MVFRPEGWPPRPGGPEPHQFSLLMWSPKPGVSMTVSFMRTPFSSISAGSQHPPSSGAGPGPDSIVGWAPSGMRSPPLPGQPSPNEGHLGCPRVTSNDTPGYARDMRAATAEVQQGLVALTPVISGGKLGCLSLSELRGPGELAPHPGPAAHMPSRVAENPWLGAWLALTVRDGLDLDGLGDSLLCSGLLH